MRTLPRTVDLPDTAYGDLQAAKLTKLLNGANHPLHDVLTSQLVPRSGRMRVPSASNHYPGADPGFSKRGA